MTNGDYVPDSAQNVRDWADNYLTELPAIATRISWPPASVTALVAALTAIRDAAQAVLDAQNALTTTLGQLSQAKTAHLPLIRKSTANLKTTSGFTDGDASTLDVARSASTFDPATYKPQIKVEAHPGYNELTGKKRGVQALNIYMRIKGVGPWTLLAAKRSTFPFSDDTPPAAAGKPEEREYMAMGVMNDEEIGQASDIVTAVYRPL